MKPGKPVAFGHIGGVTLIGLPGNPVSTAVTFELFARPLLRKLQGHHLLVKPQIEVIIQDNIHDKATRRHYVRAYVEWQGGHFVAHTTGKQDSHIMTSLLHANAFVIVPEGSITPHAGDKLKALMLEWPEVEAWD
jgi:molybdopterin molybdotransferase